MVLVVISCSPLSPQDSSTDILVAQQDTSCEKAGGVGTQISSATIKHCLFIRAYSATPSIFCWELAYSAFWVGYATVLVAMIDKKLS